ncbi:MAG TPA: cephalosporin hydroxylase, partial [Gammaproteobacteria bacterium]|nr:cephalosporin hydroxylase [Gammaproteobacteria bacterium]
MGIRALTNPFDAWIYQEILYEVQPEVIIEIGSNEGGSTLFFAHMLDLLKKGSVISIDIDRSRFQAKHDRIELITGDCSDPAIVAAVHDRCRGEKVLV